MATAPSARSFQSLQAGRGIAALIVVLFHSSLIIGADKYWGATLLGGVFGFGFAGVEFFFVLSGFLMILVHRNDIDNNNTAAVSRYFRKRAIRIYPIYWIVTLVVFVGAVALSKNEPYDLISSLLLVGGTAEGILGVSWTLFHEIIFYTLFSLLLLNKRLGIYVFILWFICCTIWFNETAPHYIFRSINLLFGFGMAAALVWTRIKMPLFWMATGAAIFFGSGFYFVFEVSSKDVSGGLELAFGAGAAVMIAGAVKAEYVGVLRVPRVLVWLGDGSYSIYLIHCALLSVLAKVWFAAGPTSVAPAVAFCVLVATCIVTGMSVHLLIERPIIRHFSQRQRSWGEAQREVG